MQNFNFTVFEDFCLSLSWKYRFLQNVNHARVQSKTNKYCKFHVDLTRRRLSKSQFKKLGMVPKKLYRNTLSLYFLKFSRDSSLSFLDGFDKHLSESRSLKTFCSVEITFDIEWYNIGLGPGF